ncbi:zinc finger protein 774-like [Trichogramma pretiosum]|uniref:zinc finger protein 774-like n=1 Tax=Trichogramma pretiosum TaxID=7493 RepID=UPI0006C95D7E|nr:zinc finger protein 774-like [Trichogramma pretiosum]
MGSISLTCPLCCGETFDNFESLKYHLLSITDNLYCPGCSLRMHSIAELTQHLDACQTEPGSTTIEDEENHENQSSTLNEDVNDIIMYNSTCYPSLSDDNFLATVNEAGQMMTSDGRALQVDENGDIQVVEKIVCNQQPLTDPFENNSRDSTENENIYIDNLATNDMQESASEIITDELVDVNDNSPMSLQQIEEPAINNTDLLLIKDENLNKEEESSTTYNCSTCDMSFSCVLTHINEYHNGQEVVLEMNETLEKELMLPVTNTKVPSQINSAANKPVQKSRQTMNTLQTEECIDSDGRLYTRKVVQIEKFWDRQPVNLPSTKAPMIEKFFSNVEGVKVRDKSVTVAPTKMYRCNQCLEQFAKLNEFHVHMCLQGTNRCQHCEQTFATMNALKNHLKTHDTDLTSQQIFLCSICGTEFFTHKSLRLHSRMHQPVRTRHVDAPEGAEEETFQCQECGTTLSESYREAHMALHASEPITCTVCNRKFDSEESLIMHAAVHMDNSNSNTNDVLTSPELHFQHQSQSPELLNQDLSSMNLSVNDSSKLTESLKSETIVSTQTTEQLSEQADLQNLKPYQCQHCGRRFMRPHEKVKHERIHTGEKPHSCEVCGKKFRVSYCLTLHMRTHTGVRPYECQHCGKRFKASSVYNHHLLTHGDKRAYTCPYCPKTFKTRVQLAGHKNSHTKPFRCTECSRPFASLYAARAHIQTHKKVNNLKFSCAICGASYGRAFALKDHMRLHPDVTNPPEASREEEVQEEDTFLLPHEEVLLNENELIVPSDMVVEEC